MHELSIAQAIVEQAERVAAREGARRVVGISVAVGGLSGVDPEALELAFPLAAEETIAESARLSIEFIPARQRCRACGAEWTADFPVVVCQACGAMDGDVIAGRELNIKAVEVESGAE